MNRIATFALAAIFTSTMAHGQDVPDRLCGYIEFHWRYSEAQGHYYRVTPQLAKRGAPTVPWTLRKHSQSFRLQALT